MGRLSDLRTHVNYELEMIPDPKTRTSAVAHLYGVSLAATMLAKKRRLDPELASMAAMLHDLWAYKNGSYEDHAHQGAALAREILEGLGLTLPFLGPVCSSEQFKLTPGTPEASGWGYRGLQGAGLGL